MVGEHHGFREPWGYSLLFSVAWVVASPVMMRELASRNEQRLCGHPQEALSYHSSNLCMRVGTKRAKDGIPTVLGGPGAGTQ